MSRHKIRMTSTRSGRVAWIRQDGTPSEYETEAGHFHRSEAEAVILDYRNTLIRVVGRCANTFDMIETP